jgi:hypothetical protein
MTVAHPKKPARGMGKGGRQRGQTRSQRKKKSREEVEDENESTSSQGEGKGNGIEVNRRGDEEDYGPSASQRAQARHTQALDDRLAKSAASNAGGSWAGGSAAGRGKAGVSKATPKPRKRPRQMPSMESDTNSREPSTDEERVALEAVVAKWKASEHSMRRVVSVNDAEALIAAVHGKYLPLLAEAGDTEEMCRRLVASVDALVDEVRQAKQE